jgi:hypothetical protein
MKVKVLRQFTDKNTSKVHSTGEIFECSKERLAEIQTVSDRLVTVIESDEAKEKKTTKKGE